MYPHHHSCHFWVSSFFVSPGGIALPEGISSFGHPGERTRSSPSFARCVISKLGFNQPRERVMVPISGKVQLWVYDKSWNNPVQHAGRAFSLQKGLDSALQLFVINVRIFFSSYYIFKFALRRANQLLEVPQNLRKAYGDYWHLCV